MTSAAVDPSATALAAVQAYCGWHIGPSQEDTLILDGSGASLLMLPSLHVTDVASISADYDGGLTVLDPTSYDWSAVGMIELRNGCFPHRFRSVTVTFTHGYSEMPANVQAVVDQITAGGIGPQAIQVGQVRVQVQSGWLSAESLLAPYKLPPRP